MVETSSKVGVCVFLFGRVLYLYFWKRRSTLLYDSIGYRLYNRVMEKKIIFTLCIL